jgi:hypothetical protein
MVRPYCSDSLNTAAHIITDTSASLVQARRTSGVGVMASVICYCGRVVAVIVLITALQTQGVAAMDEEKRANIGALLKDMGMLTNMNRIIDLLVPQIIGNLKKINREIPDAAWEEFTNICTDEMKRSLPELEEPVIAIYDDNFSADEVKQLVAFYQSPVGRKIVSQLPQLMQQSMTMGQSWGQQAGARAVERIRAIAKQKGYDL